MKQIFGLGMLLVCCGAAPKERLDPFGEEVPLPPALAELLDPDGNGEITQTEAESAIDSFQKLAKSRKPIGQEIRKALDANADRKVDADEAKLGVARGRSTSKGVANEVVEVVKALDKDGDQKISVIEFRGIVQELGVLGMVVGPKLGEFFNGMDANRDGQISLVESQRGAEYLMDQVKLAEAENRRKQRLKDPIYQQAIMAVSALDRNQDQLISKPEAKKQKEVNNAFLEIDADRDEQLTADECYAYLKAQAAGKMTKQPKIEFMPKGKMEVIGKRKPAANE